MEDSILLITSIDIITKDDIKDGGPWRGRSLVVIICNTDSL